MRRKRYLLSIIAGLAASAVLILTIAAWQFGPAETKARVVEALDDWHIVGMRTHFLRKAAALERADPSRDAEAAVRTGDKRLLGFSLNLDGPLILPGVADDLLATSRKQLGVRLLFQGSIEGPEFERYREATVAYVSHYNATLLRLTGIRGGAA